MAEAITINDQELAIICDLMALAVRPSEEGRLRDTRPGGAISLARRKTEGDCTANGWAPPYGHFPDANGTSGRRASTS